MYDNYGIGLTLCSEVFRRAGKFLIASKTSAMWLLEKTDVPATTRVTGTAIRLVLHSKSAGGILDRVRRELSASVSSSALISKSLGLRLGLEESDTQNATDES